MCTASEETIPEMNEKDKEAKSTGICQIFMQSTFPLKPNRLHRKHKKSASEEIKKDWNIRQIRNK